MSPLAPAPRGQGAYPWASGVIPQPTGVRPRYFPLRPNNSPPAMTAASTAIAMAVVELYMSIVICIGTPWLFVRVVAYYYIISVYCIYCNLSGKIKENVFTVALTRPAQKVLRR